MVIYRILVLDWTGQNVACYEIESTTFEEPIGPPDSDALESGDDLIPHARN